MKEIKKTLYIIAILIITVLGLGLIYKIKAEGSGTNENAKPGEYYNVSIGMLAELGLFRW